MEIEQAVLACKNAVVAAGKAALPFFQSSSLRVEDKSDGSPVTQADKAAEVAILECIRKVAAKDAILTEESGYLQGDQDKLWIVDPLDGTRGFSRGGAFWGPLVAYEQDGTVVAGAIAMPVMGDIYWAGKGLGCFHNDKAIQLTSQTEWKKATLSCGEMSRLLTINEAPGIIDLITTAASVRCLGDVAAVAMVLSGRADLWIEAGVKTWDLAPHKILLEEAGGIFTDLRGELNIRNGDAIGGSVLLHDYALAIVKKLKR